MCQKEVSLVVESLVPAAIYYYVVVPTVQTSS